MLLGRDDGPRPVVDRQRVRRGGARSSAPQADLDHRSRVLRVVDVVDGDVGPALGVELQRPRVAQLPVGEQLDLALDELEAEVGDRR